VRVLVVRAGALGDLVLLRPTFASLRGAGAHITLLAPTRPAAGVRADVDDTCAWESAEVARWWADPEARPSRLAERFDAALCYSRHRDVADRVGTLADRVIVRDPDPAVGHAADWLAGALDDVSVPRVAAPVCRASTEEQEGARPLCDLLPTGFLAVHPGSGSPQKNWPAARFAELIGRLSPGRAWLLSLGPADGGAEALADQPGAVVTRDLPPRALGAVLARSGLYVGNDSGVSHLAAGWGAPTLALFGPTDPAVWRPLGPHVRTLRADDSRLESIGVDQAAREAERLRATSAAL
jgi:ADP-heptose:LPS heptosyltransferase